ncbi:hypothetical protein H072_3180 [Dactylellina haptotyla CBS 200.50]|uniref:D-arabinono-1,4-lactone oxidase n=1 Tax=Dactylellina haptotyla (strain CBS 200.50) TaxID=1284197 RepID=S8AIL2_DACHA|nr:hypothetical protein H072_3180 [Dactylellina haptotyla CBS 200.50]
MEAQAKATVELLKVLVADPENEEHLDELKKRIINGDDSLDHAAHSVIARLFRISVTWSNCINQQICYPIQIRKPRCLDDIVTAISDAQKRKITIRATGSGHSYSNVAPVFKGGLLLDPHDMNRVLIIDPGLLKYPLGAGKLFAVESGITIKDLNTALDKRNLALANMGAYDGQTLAGAISTGTHGTGITLGPIASSVRAVVLVSGDGTVYQIEPSQGISDPEAFDKQVRDRILKQDDDWFNTVVISMGCTGIIYSYILEVVDSYYLEENRDLSTWEQVKQDLTFPVEGRLPKVLTENRHYEVDINPYPVKGRHSCVVQTKNKVDADHPSGSRGIEDWIAGILAGCPLAEYWLVRALNLWPTTSPEIINNALNSLVVKHHIDKSYKILNLGPVDNVKALAVELSYPVDEHLVGAIDNLLSVFQNEANKMNWYMAGPFSLRFVAASDAYLAPQQGRLTCMVELDMLLGITTGDELLTSITRKVQRGNSQVRVHWGLDLDTISKESIKELYPKYSEWFKVYSELNTMGIFDSPFTDRLEISVNPLR